MTVLMRWRHAFLLFSFINGTGSSFLAYAIMAERSGSAGLPAQQGHKRKGFFYLGGLTEGAETILVLAAMLVWRQNLSQHYFRAGLLADAQVGICLSRSSSSRRLSGDA